MCETWQVRFKTKYNKHTAKTVDTANVSLQSESDVAYTVTCLVGLGFRQHFPRRVALTRHICLDVSNMVPVAANDTLDHVLVIPASVAQAV